MSSTLQFKRDTTAAISAITGSVGELYVDTTKHTVVVLDGAAAGGFPLATEAYFTTSTSGNVLISVAGGLPVYQNTLTLAGGTISASINTGALIVAGGVGVAGAINVANTATIYSIAESTSTTTGALIVAGGAGVAGALNVGTYVSANNGLMSVSTYTGSYTDGIVVDYTTGTGRISVGTADGLTIYNGGPAGIAMVSISTSTQTAVTIYSTASSTSTSTGALVVRGGVGIAGNVNVNGTFRTAMMVKNINTQTTGTYVLSASDSGNIIQWSTGTTSTMSLPGTIPPGFYCDVVQAGTAQIVFTATSGSVIVNKSGVTFNKTVNQWAVVNIRAISTSTTSTTTYFVISGDVSA